MLPDKVFIWPYPGDSLEAAVGDIKPLLEKSSLVQFLDSPSGDLAEFIALECRAWNISPWWVLVSMQREQSALTAPSLTRKALDAICGFVGEDVGRVALPGYYGVYQQVQRLCEQTAWLLGIEDSAKWPIYWRTKKTVKRWRIGLSLSVEQPDGTWKDQMPVSRGEYLQLAYTPHYQTTTINERIAHQIVPLRYL